MARKEVIFLGHRVSEKGLQPDPRLLQSIENIREPTTVRELRAYLGLVGYYRRFITNFSKIAAPLFRLLEKNSEYQWTEECKRAFLELKRRLLKEPIVAYPDFHLPFRLYTDASNIGLGAVLAQVQGGKEKIICCAS